MNSIKNRLDKGKTLISIEDLSKDVANALEVLSTTLTDECILPTATNLCFMIKNNNVISHSVGRLKKFTPHKGHWAYCYGKDEELSILWDIRIHQGNRYKDVIQYFYVSAAHNCFVYMSQIDVLNSDIFTPICYLLRECLESLHCKQNSIRSNLFLNQAESFVEELINAGAFPSIYPTGFSVDDLGIARTSGISQTKEYVYFLMRLVSQKESNENCIEVVFRSESHGIDLQLSVPLSVLDYQDSFQALVDLLRLKSIDLDSLGERVDYIIE